jgi:hypothetical protein
MRWTEHASYTEGMSITYKCTRSDNKVRELSTMCLPWQQLTETSVWFDDVGISAFHSCVVVGLGQSSSDWRLLFSVCVGVPSPTTQGSCITTMHLLTGHCLWGSL